MSVTVAVLTTGSEILDGRVVDTNSNFVAQHLSDRGIKLIRVLSVDDEMTELLSGLRYLHEVADIVITSGGLGPTEDDLTREMAAQYVGVTLEEFPEARAHLENFYRSRKRVLDPSNLRQALLPKGSRMIPNPSGTAPGFIVSCDRKKMLCSLSGVPREFKSMFLDTVLPLIVGQADQKEEIQRRPFKLFGLPESQVGKEVVALNLPPPVAVSYRAVFPEVHLVLKATDVGQLDVAARAVRTSPTLSPFIFSQEKDGSLASLLSEELVNRNATLAVAESCTGGLLAAAFTALPGASRFFVGGVLAYSNDVKREHLGVSAEQLDTHGAVSREVAATMAMQVRSRYAATFGVSITGIAGPSGGSPEKPVGTFFVAMATADDVVVERCLFVNDRSFIQRYATHAAMELMRRTVLGVAANAPFPAAVDDSKES